MYKVIIVDDEPPIIRSTKRAIERCSNHFEVIGEAYNGAEALKKIAITKPDVIFTDIKMPVMDGILLVKKINELYPDEILPVIISGYQDFNYAKEALKSGVVEYLLKPIDPECISDLLQNLSAKLAKIYNLKSTDILYRTMNSSPTDPDLITHYLDCKFFAATMIRSVAFMGCFNNTYPIQDSSFIQSTGLPTLIPSYRIDRFWLLNSKNENEIILLFGYLQNVTPPLVEEAVKIIYDHLTANFRSVTAVFSSTPVELAALPNLITNILKKLDQHLIFGKNQLLNHEADLSEVLYSSVLDSSLENKLSALIQLKSFAALKDEMGKLFQTWEQQLLPQILIARALKQIIRLIEKNAPLISISTSINIDKQFEEIFALSSDYRELSHNVWDIIEDLFQEAETLKLKKESSNQLIQKIESFLKLNLSEPISLQRVCEMFNISQPYLSRQFRTYKNLSFNDYITNLRINEAKKLMTEQPNMLLKDIAEIVGYQDQHYFSRIFKIVTGISPSDYRK
jgi:two-component system, response regulator YesN